MAASPEPHFPIIRKKLSLNASKGVRVCKPKAKISQPAHNLYSLKGIYPIGLPASNSSSTVELAHKLPQMIRGTFNPVFGRYKYLLGAANQRHESTAAQPKKRTNSFSGCIKRVRRPSNARGSASINVSKQSSLRPWTPSSETRSTVS